MKYKLLEMEDYNMDDQAADQENNDQNLTYKYNLSKCAETLYNLKSILTRYPLVGNRRELFRLVYRALMLYDEITTRPNIDKNIEEISKLFSMLTRQIVQKVLLVFNKQSEAPNE